MYEFHRAYHLLAAALQYVWGLIAALVVYVILPFLALVFIASVIAVINGKGRNNG